MPGQVRADKQHITNLVGQPGWIGTACEFGADLVNLLMQLVENRIHIGPVETHPGRALLQLDRALPLRQSAGNAGKGAVIGVTGGFAFTALDRFPVAQHFLGRFRRGLGKHMRMP